MVTFGRGALCKDAELHYYDYLCNPHDSTIPQPIIDHIRRCTHCKERIGQLEALLVQGQAVDQAPRRRTDADLVDTLSLHFASLGENVTCAKMKSFLPALLLPSLEIRIPTPVTVHLDHCRPCAEDLEAIRELQLGPGQLARLSRLYAVHPEEDREMCRRTRSQLGARNCISLDDVDTDVLDHACVCPRCRTRIYQYRERIVTGPPQRDADAEPVVCGSISTADLFEIVVPYGRLAGGAKPEISSHVGACPACMERLQSLHGTIYSVAERADSGVVTVYTCADKTKKTVAQPRGMYAGYPVAIEVIHQPQAPALVRRLSMDRLRAMFGRVSLRSVSPSVKVALLAAAVIPLVVLLVISSQTASATSIRRIYGAVKGVENLHVVKYGRDTTKPVYELLVARAAGRVGLKGAAEQTLYNVKTRRIEVRYTKEGIVENAPLEPEEFAGLQRFVDNTLGFAITGIPMDTELQRLPPEAVPNVEDDSEVYELTWPGKSVGEMMPRYRMRVFLDPMTRLPRKTETFWWTPDDPQWRVETTRLFDYPSRQAADLAIKGTFIRR
jgi:hypothetical protein